MKTLSLLVLAISLLSCSPAVQETESVGLAYKDHFYIGAALNATQFSGATDTTSQTLIQSEFSSYVSENCLKSMFIQPEKGTFFFDDADQYVAYGEKNNKFIVGHALVWHSQVPDWIFVDENGQDVSREELINRMRTHIHTLVGRYKGRIHGWDVVNEAISDNDGETLRQSKWQQIIGDDFIELAFQFAHEADPEAELYYNDYSMYDTRRREVAVQIVKNLQAKGIRVHGIGMQAHYGLDTPINEVEKSIVTFAALGIKVMVTELDVSVLPFPSLDAAADVNLSVEYQQKYNPYPEGLPMNVELEQALKYKDLFTLFLKHSEAIDRVTFWGVNDGDSWKNNWPIAGRTDYCLVFDRANKPKAAYETILSLVK